MTSIQYWPIFVVLIAHWRRTLWSVLGRRIATKPRTMGSILKDRTPLFFCFQFWKIEPQRFVLDDVLKPQPSETCAAGWRTATRVAWCVLPLDLFASPPWTHFSRCCRGKAPQNVLGWDARSTRQDLGPGFFHGKIEAHRFQGFSEEPVTIVNINFSAEKSSK
jgi:hypothetical protein